MEEPDWRKETLKKAIIEVCLITEAAETSNKELEREILEELSQEMPKIPWQGRIVKVTVVED